MQRKPMRGVQPMSRRQPDGTVIRLNDEWPYEPILPTHGAQAQVDALNDLTTRVPGLRIPVLRGAFPDRVSDPWNTLEPPAFPHEALPKVLCDFVMDRARIIGADPCALAWSAISACSAALHGGIRLQIKRNDGWSVPPAIWVCLVGSSSTKKTPVINATWRGLSLASSKIRRLPEFSFIGDAKIGRELATDFVAKPHTGIDIRQTGADAAAGIGLGVEIKLGFGLQNKTLGDEQVI
jgi:Protein of unknown function (DUF3987)